MKRYKRLVSALLCLCLLLSLFPVTARAASVLNSGTCGENLSWTLDSEGVLTVSGTGAMNTGSGYEIWKAHKEDIVQLVLEEGVTSVSDNAFRGNSRQKTVRFLGSMPECQYAVFPGIAAEASYPANDPSWTEEGRLTMGGDLVWGAAEPDVTFVAASLSLKGDIGLNYYAELSERILSDGTAYMSFSGSGAEKRVSISEGVLDESDGSYRYSVALNAKNMGDDVTAQVCAGGNAVGDSKTLSIKYYADYVINNSSRAVFVNLMKAMLNYGAAVQVNFGYDVENLVNADMAEADRTLPETLDAADFVHTWSGEEPGIEVTSASLLLQSETKIRIYFKLAEGKSLDDFTFTIDGVEVTPVQSGDEYYIEKPNVAAKDLDTMYTFCLGDRQLTYCGLSYVNQVINYSKDENLINLAKALYAYNQAANDYFQPSDSAAEQSRYPRTYSDATCEITITKEWYENAWCYIAHLQFSDYSRFGTACANGSYDNGYETTSHAAERLDAIFAVNGCYSAPYLNYSVVRSGVLCNGSGRNLLLPAVYSNRNGLLQNAYVSGGAGGIVGQNLDSLVESGLVTDTFCFGPPILQDGAPKTNSDTGRAQRTFIGTNGNPGDIWIVVCEGRKADGESDGLTYTQCARLLVEKGCMFGIPLDGGGSSTMVFLGEVLNSAREEERPVVDFVFFK